ncbi:MAG: potassium channel family protein [Candidatus Odinarchaeia archaeon]
MRRPPFGTSKYCILHADFNECDLDSEKLNELKKRIFEEKLFKGEFNFEGIKISEIIIVNKYFKYDLVFTNSIVSGNVVFRNVTLNGSISLDKVKIAGDLIFDDVSVKKDISINGAELAGQVVFELNNVNGKLTFYKTKFKNLKSQADACMYSRKILEGIGDREGADYHFYREMEARRKLKPPLKRILELPVQYMFGYGVYWKRTLAIWVSVILSIGVLFWIGDGVEGAKSLWDCIYFSIVTATTLGYGDLHPKPGIYQGIAAFEAVFGSFIWAAFIVIFARKYMR